MSPLVKKVITAIAIKEGVERVQEWRRPKKRSFAKRAGRVALVAGIGGGLYYLYSSGKLDGLIEQLRAKPGSDDYVYSATEATAHEPS